MCIYMYTRTYTHTRVHSHCDLPPPSLNDLLPPHDLLPPNAQHPPSLVPHAQTCTARFLSRTVVCKSHFSYSGVCVGTLALALLVSPLLPPCLSPTGRGARVGGRWRRVRGVWVVGAGEFEMTRVFHLFLHPSPLLHPTSSPPSTEVPFLHFLHPSSPFLHPVFTVLLHFHLPGILSSPFLHPFFTLSSPFLHPIFTLLFTFNYLVYFASPYFRVKIG